ncbi:MAG: hypothetical protein RJB34_571 [Pseudomonadota bacterium]|jgi:mannose-1-phosphate guanylyltransferase/mannose-6-phosphate isomerase
MVPLDAGWSDLGAWGGVWNVLPKDQHCNAHAGDVPHTESQNTLVHDTSGLASLVGVSDLMVETPDAVLMTSKANNRDLIHIVSQLTTQNREERCLHRQVHRSWAWYNSIDESGRFKLKRIQVKPGSIALEIIEVQSACYLGEDDIIRFEDTYGRNNQ